ncbi:MAG TPA: pyridoxine 5'-phosphate synthase [Verrucomicrobiae bacterium]|nr:pyridoxine 5'-phosphate synthase [Verrucomicrobiae bacterium]
MKRRKLSLGVNIDHVATLRQARRGKVPSPALAAVEAVKGGADQITLHLREDRRHIQDGDLPEVKQKGRVPVNLEMALDPGILSIALRYRPEKVCIVPEKRRELTTEGGLDAVAHAARLKVFIPKLRAQKIAVSLFIDPLEPQIRMAAKLGANAIEIHTGTYAEVSGARRRREIKRIAQAARLAHALGLAVHAGHGLDYENVGPIARIPEIEELNIGYSIVARAMFTGMRQAVREMKNAMRRA